MHSLATVQKPRPQSLSFSSRRSLIDFDYDSDFFKSEKDSYPASLRKHKEFYSPLRTMNHKSMAHQEEDRVKVKQYQETIRILEAEIQKFEEIRVKFTASEAAQKISTQRQLELQQELSQAQGSLEESRSQYEESLAKAKKEIEEAQEELSSLKLSKQQVLDQHAVDLQALKESRESSQEEMLSEIREKEERVKNLEIELNSLLQEQEISRQSLQELHEAKVMINEFKGKIGHSSEGEFLPDLEFIVSEFEKCQLLIKEKELDSEELQRREEIRSGLLRTIDELEKEKGELSHALDETKEELERLTNQNEILKSEVSTIAKTSQIEKQNFLKKLEENENTIQTLQIEAREKDIKLLELKSNFEREKSLLQFEMNTKAESTTLLTQLQELNQTLKTSVQNLGKDKSSLQDKVNEYVNKEEGLMDELKSSKKQKDRLDAEVNKLKSQIELLKKEKVDLNAKFEESNSNHTASIRSLEEKLTMKDQYIEALIFDVNQMKEFIVEYHGEAVFEKDEKEDVKESSVPATPELKEEEEEEKPQREERKRRDGPASKTVVVVVEKPANNYSRGKEREKTYRPAKPWTQEVVYYKRKESDKTEVKTQQKEETEQRNESSVFARIQKTDWYASLKEKKMRDDPIYKQLELMIKELNEKVNENETRTRKVVEEKLAEQAQAYEAREQRLYEDIEGLKNEKKDLLKKIDDIQWDKAYEYTEKMKAEQMNAPKVVEKNPVQTSQGKNEGKKKNKK